MLELSTVDVQLDCLCVTSQLPAVRFAYYLAFGTFEALSINRYAAEALSAAPPPAIDIAAFPPVTVFLFGPAPYHVLKVVISIVFPAVIEPVEGFLRSLAFLPIARERRFLTGVTVSMLIVALEICLAFERR